MRYAALLVLGLLASPYSVPNAPAAREVEVEVLDYTFRAPTALPPGRTVFRLVNRGKVRHEFNLVLLAPGVTVDQLNTITDPDKTRDAATVAALGRMIEATVGVLFAGPGRRGSAALATDLLPGRTYAIRCVARDSASAPAHFALGMYSVLRVTNARSAAAPATPVRADTIRAMDYAYRFPTTLSPGLHTIAFVNTGKQRHMALLALLRPGATLQTLMDLAKARKDPTSAFEHMEGVLHSFVGQPQPLGVLQVRLLPERDYLLFCNIADSATAPPHFMLGMSEVVHVTAR